LPWLDQNESVPILEVAVHEHGGFELTVRSITSNLHRISPFVLFPLLPHR